MEESDHIRHRFRHGIAVWGTFLAVVYVECGELDLALDAAQKSCQADDKNYLPKLGITAVYVARSETANAKKGTR